MLFVFLCLISALVVYVVYLLFFKIEPPTIVGNVLYIGLTSSISILGVHIGISGAITAQKGMMTDHG